MPIKYQPEFVFTNGAAEILKLAPSTLVAWRARKTYSLSYYKSGGKVLYAVADLIAFLESRKVHPVKS